MPEPSISHNEDNKDKNFDKSNNQDSNTKSDDSDLEDLFSIETEEELDKIAQKGIDSYNDGLSNVAVEEKKSHPIIK